MYKNNDYCTIFALVALIQGNVFLFKVLLIYEDDVKERFAIHFRKKFYINLKNAIGYSLAIWQLAISKPNFEGSKKLIFFVWPILQGFPFSRRIFLEKTAPPITPTDMYRDVIFV